MMNKKKLEIARNKIDQIDNKIFNLIKKRTHVVRHMLNLKKNKGDIIDYKRIRSILRKIKNKSTKNKLDHNIQAHHNAYRYRIHHHMSYMLTCW